MNLFHLVGNDGMSMRRAATELNARGIPTPAVHRGFKFKDGKIPRWNNASVRLVIVEETYKGVSYSHKLKKVGRKQFIRASRDQWIPITDSPTPPIVDAELWDGANRSIRDGDLIGQRSKRSAETRNESSFALFRGIIFCGNCGGPLRVAKSPRWSDELGRYKCDSSNMFYRCETRRLQKERGIVVENPCYGQAVYERKVRDRIWEAVVEFVSDERMVEKEIVRLKSSRPGETLFRESLDAARSEIIACDRRVKNLVASMAEEDDSEVRRLIRDKIDGLKKERDRHQSRAPGLESKLSAYDSLDRRADDLRLKSAQIRDGMSEPGKLTWEERRAVIDGLDVRIIGNGEVVSLLLNSGLESEEVDQVSLAVPAVSSRR